MSGSIDVWVPIGPAGVVRDAHIFGRMADPNKSTVPISAAGEVHPQTRKPRSKAHTARLPSFAMLVGLPGSGKSTFRNLLMKQNGAASAASSRWAVVSQDDTGSRRACETAIGILAKDKNVRVILDRCNPDPEDRKYWLGLAWRPKDAVCVHFDVHPRTCIERVSRRAGHKTIKSGTHVSKVERIVFGFAKRMQPPDRKEGFSRVHVLKTPADTAALLEAWGVSAKDLEFMHREHEKLLRESAERKRLRAEAAAAGRGGAEQRMDSGVAGDRKVVVPAVKGGARAKGRRSHSRSRSPRKKRGSKKK